MEKEETPIVDRIPIWTASKLPMHNAQTIYVAQSKEAERLRETAKDIERCAGRLSEALEIAKSIVDNGATSSSQIIRASNACEVAMANWNALKEGKWKHQKIGS